MNKIPLSPELIDVDKYQVLVCSSPANLMVGFASHTWFVINCKGKLSRWEILHDKKNRESSKGYLNKDYFEPFTGIEIWPNYELYKWKGTVLDILTGDENSVATEMIRVIENSFIDYSAIERYSLLGPNSNSYTQWVLDKFPQVQMSLPWNAFGKGYSFDAPSN